jgi:hypothetical protein
MILPRCGTLLTYGSADVMRTLRWPGIGNLTPDCSGTMWGEGGVQNDAAHNTADR